MEDERTTLIQNNTSELVPRPSHANIVTGKWIFKHKFNSDGSLDRYKARWIFTRPSVLSSSLLLSGRFCLSHFLVTGPFLSSMSRMRSCMALSETVYCAQLAGFEDSAHPNFVCRLNKSLYGLKQAPRCLCFTGVSRPRTYCSMLMTLCSRLLPQLALTDYPGFAAGILYEGSWASSSLPGYACSACCWWWISVVSATIHA